MASATHPSGHTHQLFFISRHLDTRPTKIFTTKMKSRDMAGAGRCVCGREGGGGGG